MKVTPAIVFILVLLVPMAHATVLSRTRGEHRARLIARSGAAFTALATVCLATTFYTAGTPLFASVSLPGLHYTLHFVLDALNAPFVMLLSCLTLAIVLGASNVLLSVPKLRALLWLEALVLLTLTAADVVLLASAYCLVLVPVYRLTLGQQNLRERTLLRRLFLLYHGTGALTFLAGCVLLAVYCAPGTLLRMSLLHLDTSAVPAGLRPWLFGLLALSCLVRMGIAPLHAWLPASLERGSVLSVTLLVSMRTGLYMLARLTLPAFPDVAARALPLLLALALFSAVYGAIVALGQHDLRRMVGFLIVSQSGIMLSGFALRDPHAASGTLLYWIGFAASTGGLMLMISALGARTGTSDMRALGGIVRRVPGLCACFFLFGLATIAIPGTVAFAAEDMLVHGAAEAHPLLTAAMILVMVLNAITVVRAFTLTFLGEARPDARTGSLEDLLARERLTAALLIAFLVFAGLHPQTLIDAQLPAVSRLTSAIP